ncbi:DUF2332 family protein [Jatrophihabitans sp. YIM 134969]
MADWTGEGVETAAWYREMAARGYGDSSPTYRRLAEAVADDPGTLARLSTLAPLHRQPNLLFGAARLLGGPVDDPPAFLRWCEANWPAVRDVVTTTAPRPTRRAAARPCCPPSPRRPVRSR